MSKKVLVATVKPFAVEAVEQIEEIFKEAGYTLTLLESYASPEDFVAAVADVDGMIVRSDAVNRDVLEAAGCLKIVVRAGAGYDNVDLARATEKGVVVMNTPGQNANAVGELALGMMVYQARNQFNGKPGRELKGKTLGLHAYGHVGRQVARIASGFGMAVYAFDPFISRSIIEADGIKPLSSVEELYSTCQYVSLHMPVNDKTRGSINYTLLSMMPRGATLVNTARKELIDEASLLRIFSAREDFTYISDVAPDCADEIKLNYVGRYYFTPKKMGAQTAEANINAGIAAARQIIAFFEKGDETCRVN